MLPSSIEQLEAVVVRALLIPFVVWGLVFFITTIIRTHMMTVPRPPRTAHITVSWFANSTLINTNGVTHLNFSSCEIEHARIPSSQPTMFRTFASPEVV